MQRRDFLGVLGGAVAWPIAARAQQAGPAHRLGVLMPEVEDDAQSQLRKRVLEESLTRLGWRLGTSLHIDYRWSGGNFESARSLAAELAALRPDVMLVVATISARAVHQATDTIPAVFVGVTEPVAQGFVKSLSHPGGNLTGFTNMEVTFGGKWLELLKEVAPGVKRVAVMLNPETTGNYAGFVQGIEAVAQKFAVALSSSVVRQVTDIHPAIAALGGEPGGGLIVLPDPLTLIHRKLIVDAANRQQLPLIGAFKAFADDGALASYGVDIPEQFRLAAGYVDRILKGEKPADLPVQQPVKFELVINLKTAKALGLTITPGVLAIADEVIE
jgi:putative tryptophan/tyrosine transport system substrate-binding protein